MSSRIQQPEEALLEGCQAERRSRPQAPVCVPCIAPYLLACRIDSPVRTPALLQRVRHSKSPPNKPLCSSCISRLTRLRPSIHAAQHPMRQLCNAQLDASTSLRHSAVLAASRLCDAACASSSSATSNAVSRSAVPVHSRNPYIPIPILPSRRRRVRSYHVGARLCATHSRADMVRLPARRRAGRMRSPFPIMTVSKPRHQRTLHANDTHLPLAPPTSYVFRRPSPVPFEHNTHQTLAHIWCQSSSVHMRRATVTQAMRDVPACGNSRSWLCWAEETQ
ncbi:hypothetical protein A0H81_10409 [Grifola frondosa]|uniref:Uncharacterized protein n=1 Tax=Grifola frondosa TaxID=5627 RepID=A0A1C7LZR1_GRIFR|nr:hypothetical protein A0H81_10409 [Grifola frondosa]